MALDRRRFGRVTRLVVVVPLCLVGAGCVRAYNEQDKPVPTDALAADNQLVADASPIDGGLKVDALPGADSAVAADAFVCPKACNKGCVSGVCLIECGLSLSCLGQVVCPPNIPCQVTCGLQACILGVDCSAASHCKIDCSGIESCPVAVICGKGSCTVSCGGPTSCGLGVDCSKSCSCSVSCTGLFSCAAGVKCPPTCTACGPKAKCGSC